MTIQRNVDPIFGVLWIAWSLMLFATVLVPLNPWWPLASFFVLEAAALVRRTAMRDQLSEVATWCQRKLSKHQRFARGWNAMLLAYVLLVAYVAGLALYRGGMPVGLVVVLSGLVTVWLYDHWVDPVGHG